MLKREISQEQINFAKMASMQNEEDPNVNNMKAIILPDINEEGNVENKVIQNAPILLCGLCILFWQFIFTKNGEKKRIRK